MASPTITDESIDVEPSEVAFTDAAVDAIAALLVDDLFRDEVQQ